MLEVMSNMDLQTVFDGADGSISESEAIEVKTLLEANGIPAVLSDTPIASLGHNVLVTKQNYSRAKRVIAEARESGRRGAAEAERASEEKTDK